MPQIIKNKVMYVGNVYDSQPVGEVIQMAGDKTPAGYIPVEAERKSVLRSAYPDLFKRIGTRYGAVDDLHFNLPSEQDVDLVNTVARLMYPVGSVKISENNVNPGSYIIGTEWELKSSGRVLQGADETHNGGDIIEAGLPNITGEWQRGNDSENTTSSNATIGAFYKKGASRSAKTLGNSSSSYAGNQRLGFDAKSGETKTDGTLKTADEPHVYGNSDTVQPPAYVVYIWKRIL